MCTQPHTHEHTCIHVCTYSNTLFNIHEHICTQEHVRMYAWTHPWIHTHALENTHAHNSDVHTLVHPLLMNMCMTYIHMYKFIHYYAITQELTCIYPHMHTQTHKHRMLLNTPAPMNKQCTHTRIYMHMHLLCHFFLLSCYPLPIIFSTWIRFGYFQDKNTFIYWDRLSVKHII